MNRVPLLALGVIATVGLVWLVAFAAFATYDAVGDGDMMDEMWEMMGDMGGMMDGGMMGGGGPETEGSASGAGEVVIEDFRFEPTILNVTPGTVVKWTNRDSAAHTATSDDFDTGRLDRGESGEIRFDRTGTFEYICTYHAQMEGRVVVAATPQE